MDEAGRGRVPRRRRQQLTVVAVVCLVTASYAADRLPRRALLSVGATSTTGNGSTRAGAPPAAAPTGRTAPTGPALSPSPPLAAPDRPDDPAVRSRQLGEQLLAAVLAQRFDEVVDREAGAQRAPYPPSIDLAVIELDGTGRPVAAAEVLLSASHPRGVSVPVNRDWGTEAVRWSRWDAQRWRQGRPGTDPLVPASPAARYAHMVTYPASVFKLLVAYGVLRLVDSGALRLDEPYAYRPGAAGCSAGVRAGTRTVRQWLDAMLTWSDNWSTCALLKRLHDSRAVPGLNAALRGLGLGTLQLGHTSAADGGSWSQRGITMTALDTARLLLLVHGPAGALWRTPAGAPVTAATGLSAAARAVLLGMLGEQGFNNTLSTANWCGPGAPARGIPHRAARRWVDPRSGSVSVPGRTFGGQDVRPCDADAEVSYAHKTGLVRLAGADAGVVTSLPGAPPRRYVVAVFSSLGTRYGDARPPASWVPSTQRLARLGQRIDTILTERAAARPLPG